MPGTFKPTLSHSQHEAIGRLDERVTNLSGRFTTLEATVTEGFQHIEATVSSLATQFAGAGRTNWSALGTWAAVIVAFGVAVYAPMLRSIYLLQEQIDSRVTIREHEMINRYTERELDQLRLYANYLRDSKTSDDAARITVKDRDDRLDDLRARMDALNARINSGSVK